MVRGPERMLEGRSVNATTALDEGMMPQNESLSLPEKPLRDVGECVLKHPVHSIGLDVATQIGFAPGNKATRRALDQSSEGSRVIPPPSPARRSATGMTNT